MYVKLLVMCVSISNLTPNHSIGYTSLHSALSSPFSSWVYLQILDGLEPTRDSQKTSNWGRGRVDFTSSALILLPLS